MLTKQLPQCVFDLQMTSVLRFNKYETPCKLRQPGAKLERVRGCTEHVNFWPVRAKIL